MAEVDELFGNEKTETTHEAFNRDEWIARKEQDRTTAYELLGEATENLALPDIYRQYLEVQAKFDRYSVSNALLIVHQCPDATRLCDSKTWQQQNVYIKKGETGIIILEPGKEYKRDDGKTITPYNAKKVFDISQTNAKPMPAKTINYDKHALVKALVKTSSVKVEITNDLPQNANALYSPQSKTIHIRQGMSGEDIFRNLAREISFARLDNGNYDRGKLMSTALSAAYIVCRRAGIEPENFGGISQSFLQADVKDKRAELSKIRDTANGISNVITKELAPKSKDRGDR